jgi:hypothetical protein
MSLIYRSPHTNAEPRQQPSQNPMEMYRLPGSTLQTGFAYIDRAHIPFTNPALNTIDDIPDLTSITTQPGFAAGVLTVILNHTKTFLRFSMKILFHISQKHIKGR